MNQVSRVEKLEKRSGSKRGLLHVHYADGRTHCLACMEKQDGGDAAKARSQAVTELPPTLEEIGKGIRAAEG